MEKVVHDTQAWRWTARALALVVGGGALALWILWSIFVLTMAYSAWVATMTA